MDARSQYPRRRYKSHIAKMSVGFSVGNIVAANALLLTRNMRKSNIETGERIGREWSEERRVVVKLHIGLTKALEIKLHDSIAAVQPLDLDRHPAYETLSYSWDRPTHEKRRFMNLNEDLHRSGSLCIDTLCIIQDTTAERTSQMENTARTYNDALHSLTPQRAASLAYPIYKNVPLATSWLCQAGEGSSPAISLIHGGNGEAITGTTGAFVALLNVQNWILRIKLETTSEKTHYTLLQQPVESDCGGRGLLH